MQEDCLVSIIIPVYNTKKEYFDSLMESLVQHSYKKLEIIVVDDGSKKEFSLYYDSFRQRFEENGMLYYVFHNKNYGVSNSRNFGIENSNGKYLCFVDSDDIVHYDYIKILLEACKRYNCPVASCGLVEFYNLKEIKKFKNLDNLKVKKCFFKIFSKEDSNYLFKGFNIHKTY